MRKSLAKVNLKAVAACPDAKDSQSPLLSWNPSLGNLELRVNCILPTSAIKS